MSASCSRRDFVTGALAAGTLAGVGDFAFLDRLAPVAAADVKLPAGKVQLSADVEPLVRLIEDQPRDRVLDAVADQMRKGAGYQDLLAAVFLAGVRGIK